MYSVFGLIMAWWMNKQAKLHPEKNTKQIIEEFLKENNIDADVKIDPQSSGVFVSKYEKQQIIKKLEKLPEDKKQKMIAKIEQDYGINVENIKDEIVVHNNIARGLHEAGHAIDYQKSPGLKKQIRDKASQVSELASWVVPDKYLMPTLVAGKSPAIAQEIKANKIAYQEMVKRFGEKEAKKRLVRDLGPNMASYIIGEIAEPMAFNYVGKKLTERMLGNILSKSATEMLREFEKLSSELSQDELNEYADSILQVLRAKVYDK